VRTPQSPSPACPPGGVPGESDEGVAALLRGRAQEDTTRPVAVLAARHRQPAYEYAVICLAASGNVASMVTTASFQQVLGRLAEGEPALALRPRLLVTVRDTVRSWAADDRMSDTLPDLRKPAGGRGMRAAGSMTAENRRLAERAFLALPGLARCLLWHTEVEGEPLSVPAALSGMDTDLAPAAWEQARDQFREGCARAHRELAPTRECGFYNRLLDIPIRRGGALLPDVREHLATCSYCRHAAEQLSHFEGGLGVLIAESVLGWGARRYLDSRPGHEGRAPRARSASPFARRRRDGGRPGGKPRSEAASAPSESAGRAAGNATSEATVRADGNAPSESAGRAAGNPGSEAAVGVLRSAGFETGGRPGGKPRSEAGGRHGRSARLEDGAPSASAGHAGTGGRHRLLSRLSTEGRRAAGPGDRPQQALLTGAGLSAALLATVLTVSLWPHDEGGADPTAATGASSSRTLSPDQASETPSDVSAPPASAALPMSTERTRLRNVEADLCLDLRSATPEEGAGTTLAVCSSAWTQQWSYDEDGLLRSVVSPGLCLDPRADDGVLFLGRCETEDGKQGEDLRYDLTAQGELLPRGNDGLAVTPASADPGADVVVKVRDGSDAQRWRTDGSAAGSGPLPIAGTPTAASRPTSRPPADGTPSPSAPAAS
jgi:hypothetical protein